MNEDMEQEAWVVIFESLIKQGKPLPSAKTREELKEKYGHVIPLVYRRKRFARIDAHRKASARKRGSNMTCSLDQVGVVPIVTEDFERIENETTLFERINQYDQRTREKIHYFVTLWCRQQDGEEISKADRQRLVRIRRETGLPLELERKNYQTRRKNLSKSM